MDLYSVTKWLNANQRKYIFWSENIDIIRGEDILGQKEFRCDDLIEASKLLGKPYRDLFVIAFEFEHIHFLEVSSG